MKIVVVLLVCIVAARGCVLDFTDKDKITQYGEECIEELGLEPSNIYDYLLADTSTCFKDCFQKKMGILNENGKFNRRKILKCAKTPAEKKRLEYLIDAMKVACKSEAEKDACKLSTCFYVYIFMLGQFPQ